VAVVLCWVGEGRAVERAEGPVWLFMWRGICLPRHPLCTLLQCAIGHMECAL
jgi:hypothetical protein